MNLLKIVFLKNYDLKTQKVVFFKTQNFKG
jgi:hypothetical protein